MTRGRAALLALVLALVWAPAATAAPPDPAAQGQFDRTVAYLQAAQNPDGGWPGVAGGASDWEMSAWMAYALATASINPLDQKRPDGTDVHTYLAAHVPGSVETTDFERALLVVTAVGTDPHDFGGVDLVAEILARRLPDGSFAQAAGGPIGFVNATAFAVIALSQIDEPGIDEVIDRALDWLVSVQADAGGWGYLPDRGIDSDMTAAVIQALRAGGRADTQAERDAFAYIRSLQCDDGGFAATSCEADVANSMSTAWVLQAMWSAGIDPRSWTATSGADPIAFLASLQNPDGSVRWKRNRDMNNVWATAQVAPALAGQPLPTPRVPRAAPDPPPAEPDPPPPSPPAPAPGDGAGGADRVGGGPVLAGGGGSGAPLFSRPQPQSQGASPGGERGTDASDRQTEPRPTERREGTEAREGAERSSGVADGGVTPVPSDEEDPGGLSTEDLEGLDSEDEDEEEGGAGGGKAPGQDVTGRLLGDAPAGTPGTGDEPAIAPGLQGAAAGDSDDGTTALVLAGLLAAAALSGAVRERRTRRWSVAA